MRQAAHHRDRQARRLALHQVARGGQFIGGGDDGGAERIAVRVLAAAQVVEHPHPGGPDRHIGEAVAPGTPEGVRDDDAHLDAQRVPQPPADDPRRTVGVLRQQQHGPGRGVGGIDTGGGHHQALLVLDDPEGAAPRHHPYRLRVDRRLAVLGLHDAALGLRDDLGGDEDDIAVRQLRRRPGDQLREIVAGLHLGQPGYGPDAVGRHTRTSSARASASRAIAAVVSGSVIISGTARQRMPASSTLATDAASTVSTSQPSSRPEP